MREVEIMDQGDAVQNEDLINDQVTQAISDSGVTSESSEQTNSGFIPAPTLSPSTSAQGSGQDNVAQSTPPVVPSPSATTKEPAETPKIQAPSAPVSTPSEEATSSNPVSNNTSSSGNGDDDELMQVKQKALEQLSPLVSHLELPPEQKFDTYMEIIRASDDKTLIQPAFETAQQIDDEDKKAQALLDVVNEVNYLTQEQEES